LAGQKCDSTKQLLLAIKEVTGSTLRAELESVFPAWERRSGDIGHVCPQVRTLEGANFPEKDDRIPGSDIISFEKVGCGQKGDNIDFLSPGSRSWSKALSHAAQTGIPHSRGRLFPVEFHPFPVAVSRCRPPSEMPETPCP
jgi:hypothetical protein